MEAELSVVGKRMPDISGVEKVTGAARFISDISLPGMLIGKVLHSPHAHAKIRAIDTSKAEKLPGVHAVVTQDDVPRKQYTGTLMNLQSVNGIEPFGVYDVRALDDKVRYVGDAVAAVAATDEKTAEAALEMIEVSYEPLPAVFDELEAVKDGAPQLHDLVKRMQEDGAPGEEAVERNLGVHVAHIPVGDVEKGFREADHIIEAAGYTTQQRQSGLETFHCIADCDARGKLTLWTPTQLPFLMRRMIAYIFDMPEGLVRVKNEYTGGAFGAGLCVFKEPLCIALAKKSGRPVKLIYSRQEEFSDRPTRARFGPYRFKMGVKKDGTITAVERKVVSTAGAHVECSALSSLIATSVANPLYRRQNSHAEADAVYTNKVPCGAMRGFGNPEETFIREQVMDEAAERIGMDPMEFRLRNLCRIGDPGTFGPAFPLTSIALAECIELGAEKIGWKEKRGLKKEGMIRRGVGMSCMAHNSGAWPVHSEHSNALIKFNEDASIVLTVFPAPIGTGATGTLAQVAAEILGLPYHDVHVAWGDTDTTLFETGSHASRTMYIIGNAVRKAALEAKGKLLKRAADKLEIHPDDLEIKDKRIFPKGTPNKGVSAAEIVKEAMYTRDDVEEITGSCSHRPETSPPPYQAAFCEVEVDTGTGVVKVLKMVLVNDSGRSINPNVVEGQLEGGTSQGLGYALWEEPVLDKRTGRLLTNDFDTYKIATTLDMPELDVILVEKPDPTGPFGAKGVGEPGCVNQAASIANAIYDAVGVRIWSLPITPEKVIKSLRDLSALRG
ncbi:MAG: molybdopterin cofactor-binding domain-containing protein [Pseudomonadota bacterium]